MSNSFNQKIIENGDRHHHVLWKSHAQHPHVKVTSMKKDQINIKQSQVLTIPKQNAVAHIKFTGQYANILSGGTVDCPIRESSGFGHVDGVVWRVDLNNNTGADCELITDFLSLGLNYIEVLTPENEHIQNIFGKEVQYEMTDIYHSKEWKSKSKIRGADKNWKKKSFIMSNGETRILYVDLIGFFLTSCGIFLPALRGEFILRFHFYDSSRTLLSGAIPQITNMELLIQSAYMTTKDYQDEMIKYRTNVLDFRYPFYVKHPFTQSMSPDTTYDIILNGFNGIFTELRFAIQPATQTGNNVKTYYPIKEYEILDSNGVNIVGGSYKTHEETMYIDYSKHYDNDQNQHINLYRYSFSADPASMVLHGQVGGFLPMGGRDQLRIRTGSAEVLKVVTVTRQAGPSAPSAGNYRLFYKGYYTSVLAFNASASAIELALEALPPFLDNRTNVTVSAAVTSNPVTISWGGQQAQDEAEELVYIDSLDINDGTDTVFFNSALTTEYIRGFPSGTNNYTINVFGVKVNRLRLDKGMMSVNSS